MAKIAYLFPGQGSQQVGMGADLCAHSPAALRVFDEADGELGLKLSTICFYGPEETLKETVNTQPALYTMSVAVFKAIQEAGGPMPEAVAGHSIGEYAALVAAGALDVTLGLQLVNRRAYAMQRAAQSHPGAMSAIIGLEAAQVVSVCQQAEQNTGHIVDAANFNSSGQVVISGTSEGVAAAGELAKAAGARRVIPLAVSGAFHSRLMAPAAETMAIALADAAIHDAAIPIVANVTADYEQSAAEIKTNLAAQIDHSVRWEETIQKLGADGFDTFVELGAGNVLSGLVKRILPGVTTLSIGDAAGVAAWVESQKG